MRSSLAARWRLLRHSAAVLLAPVVVGSGVAGFISGQVAGRLPYGLALTQTSTHRQHQQQSGQVQGALGQRVGGQVVHQTVVARSVYVPPSTPAPGAQSSAHPRPNGSSGGSHADTGQSQHGTGKKDGGHGKQGKQGKGDHGDRGKDGHGAGQRGGRGHGTDRGGGMNGHGNGGGPHPLPVNSPRKHGKGHGHDQGHG